MRSVRDIFKGLAYLPFWPVAIYAEGTHDSTSYDISDKRGDALIVRQAGPTSVGIVSFAVQHSDDNVTFSAIPTDALTNLKLPSLGHALQSCGSAADVHECARLRLSMLKRYIRIEAVADNGGSGMFVVMQHWLIAASAKPPVQNTVGAF